jgi:hypothetical protein
MRGQVPDAITHASFNMKEVRVDGHLKQVERVRRVRLGQPVVPAMTVGVSWS